VHGSAHWPEAIGLGLRSLMEEHATGRSSAVAVGTFDGVHLGHQSLLGAAVGIARNADRPTSSVAIVFVRPPRTVLRPERDFAFLGTMDEREALIRALGVEVVVPVEFDESVRDVTPAEFATMLSDTMRMEHFVSGPGSAVGRDRSGSAEAMREIGEANGFSVHPVPPSMYNGDSISSTLVRTALSGGRMGEVSGMLGRRYSVSGIVTEGHHRGTDLGFPTANLSVGEPGYPIALPADGIYATWAILDDGRRVQSATSIGVRPTFGDGEARTVESHLLDWEGNLYTRALSLEFVRRLRPEEKFEDVDSLIEQIKKDVESARSVLVQE
jgi:riboflavin kinase / FMN adenylyltransferase